MAGRSYLTHDETLELVEEFMRKSGIRRYCSDFCRGHCCGKCYNSDNACRKNEGRRLACSIYLCYDIVKPTFPPKAAELRADLRYEINQALRRASKQEYPEVYFKPYSKAVIERFKLFKQKSNLEKLIDYYAPKIRTKIQCFCFLVERAETQRHKIEKSKKLRCVVCKKAKE
jgi:hypothetical protein